MTPRMRHWLAAAALALASLLVVAVAALAWLLGTTSGARWVLARAAAASPGALRVGAAQGTLGGGLELRDLAYGLDSLEVAVDSLSFAWRPAALLGRRVEVRSFSAAGVRITLGPARPESASAERPDTLADVSLPFDVVIREVRLRRLAIAQPGGAHPLRIDAIGADTLAFLKRLDVRRFAVRAPLGDLDLEGDIRPRGDYPLDLRLRWAVRPPDGPEIAGAGTLAGSLERLVIEQRASAPAPAELRAVLVQPLSDPRIEATLDVPRFDAQEIRQEWPPLQVGLHAELRGAPDSLAANGAIQLESPATGPLAARFRIARQGASWRIERLELRDSAGAERLVARGEVAATGPEPRVDLEARWRGLTWPLTGDTLLSSPRGELRVAGTPADYRLRLDAALRTAGGIPSAWRLSGRGDTTRLWIDSLRVTLLRGRIEGRGTLGWAKRPEWSVALEARDLDPSATWPDWPGRLRASARSRGRVEKSGPAGSLEIGRLSGDLRGRPIEGALSLHQEERRTVLEDLRGRWGAARISAAGSLEERWDLSAELEFPDLSLVADSARGTLHAKAAVEGPRVAPQVSVALQAESLAVGLRSVDRLALDAAAGLGREGRIEAGGWAEGLAWGGPPIRRLTFEARGPRDAQVIRVAARAARDSLAMELAGTLAERSWSGELRALTLVTRDLGEWRLEAPAAVRLSAEEAGIEGFRWGAGEGRITASGTWRARAPWSFRLDLQQLPLAFLDPALPPESDLEGRLDGDVAVGATGAGFIADARIAPGPGTLRFPIADGTLSSFAFERGTLELHSRGRGLRADMVLPFATAGSVEGHLQVPEEGGPEASGTARPLQGRFTLRLQDLGVIEAFVPGMQRTRGDVRADFEISGTTEKPRVTGQARLAGGQADVPAAGLEVRDVTLAAASDGRNVTLEGTARSGPGTLELQGRADLEAARQPSLTLTLSGRRFRAMNTREIKLLLDPDLKLDFEARRIDVNGQVTVPEATVDLGGAPSPGTVPVSSDVVVVGGGSGKQAETMEVHSRVRMVLGEGIRFKAAGLDARPAGSILVIDEPRRPTTGSGELNLGEGTFRAYGQDLKIERGRLIFAGGPIENPGLDVRATRRAQDGTVAGFEIRGTVKSPELTIVSQPPMPEQDALAYILLGHPLRESSQAEGSLVSRAANSLELQGGSLLAREIAGQFGIQEASLESEGSLEEASLVLGTYLSPRLYVSYGVGLFEPISTFRLRYLLSRRWTLEAETAAESGADVIYSIEH